MEPTSMVYFENNNVYSTLPVQSISLICILPEEQWKDITDEVIKDIEPRYSISTYGRIFDKSLNNIAQLYIHDKGYILANIRLKNGSIISALVHRLVKLVFDYIPGCEELDVDHKNCIKCDNYLYNLDWVTRQENIIRAHQNNLCAVGEDYYKSIFTNEEVHNICKLLENKTPIKEISKIMNETIFPRQYANMESTIYGILYRECWNNISKDYIFPSYNDYNFTNNQVKQICKYLQDNISYDDILINLGYSINDKYEMEKIEVDRLKNTISNIRNRRNYTEISKDYIFDKFDKRNYNDEQVKYICDCIKNTNLTNAEIFHNMNLNIDPKFRKKYIGTINDIRNKKCFKQISDKYF